MKKFFLLILLLLATSAVAQAERQPLPPQQVFTLNATAAENGILKLHWSILPGYYLYKDRFEFQAVSPIDLKFGKINFPNGIKKYDEVLGNYQVYYQNLTLDIPLKQNTKLKVTYQGCSEAGFCYAPISKTILFNKSNMTATILPPITNIPAVQSEQDKITQILGDTNLIWIIFGFLGFGLVLTFTPCVLPMIPILSGIILGEKEHPGTRKAFFLSLAYVLGMSITYAIAGIITGFVGHNLQTTFQQPWIIILFALIFIALALSMFGLYEITLPNTILMKLRNLSNKQKHGSYIGAAIMGCLSTLIVSPCITPPLVGALAFIGKTGDALKGGLALFAMGIGSGIPLIIFGTAGTKLLPKTGAWMNAAKIVLGVMLLAVAIWMLSRILPEKASMFLFAALFIICASYMGLFESTKRQSGWKKLWRGCALLLATYGILMIIGIAMGNTDPLNPLANLHLAEGQTVSSQKVVFKKIKTVTQLEQNLQQAKQEHKIVLLDFYANWCVSCKIMEKTLFSDPAVHNALRQMVLLQADVTANDAEDKLLQTKLGVFAPPTIIFFAPNGNEMPTFRIVGETNKVDFLTHISQLKSAIMQGYASNSQKNA